MKQDSFRALGVSAQVAQALGARDIRIPFPIQALVLPEALAGRDVLAKAPTGSGKTLAFGLALVERLGETNDGPEALVLVPTRELAAQVAEALGAVARPKRLRVAAVYGGVPLGMQAKRAAGAHVLVATPGRLQDLVERRLVRLDHVRILVLDEADRMLDMGFRPQVERILRRLRADRQTMLFSATLDGDVGDLARSYMRNPSRVQTRQQSVESHGGGEVEHRFVPVTATDKFARLVHELGAERGLALVFVRTRRGVDRLAHELARHMVAARARHGDLTQSARERAIGRFRLGDVTTLIATDVAARGLDLVDVTHVINFDPPADDGGYVHRVGRTGRAGRSGSGVTLMLPEQQADVSRLAARLGHREQFESQGLPVARSRLVYTSRRGHRSRW
jgi:superfamily II DNA/RNA helicase